MASNFPNPNEINEDTGALWESGDTWTDSESGVIYIYDPIFGVPSWRTDYQSVYNDKNRYVELVGDNMVGDLTFADDRLRLSTSGAAEFAGGQTIIDSSGNVGIGTASPSQALEVSGNIQIGDTATDAARIDFGSASTRIQHNGDDNLPIFTNGAERMRVSSAGYLGINNTNPRGLIHVGADLTSGAEDAAAINLKQTGTGDSTGIYLERSGERKGYHIYIGGEKDSLNFQLNNSGVKSHVMVLDRVGNVGIGRTTPGDKLDILSMSGNCKIKMQAPAGSVSGFNAIGTDTLVFETGFKEAARIDESGKLLVGTTTARAIATQSQAIQNEGTNFETVGFSTCRNSDDVFGPYIFFGKSRSTSIGGNTIVNINDDLGGCIWAGADGNDINTQVGIITYEVDGNPSANRIPGRFVVKVTETTGPTERMRISSNGDVKFTTHLQAPSQSGNILIGPNKNYGLNFNVNIDSSGFPSALIEGPDAAGAITVRAGSQGGMYINQGGTSWISASDERLKTNLTPIQDGLNKVSTLNAFVGEFKEDVSKKRTPFLLAQEVEQILPEAVDTQDSNRLGLSYTGLIPLLVAALKEAKERIENLEAKVATLEAQ